MKNAPAPSMRRLFFSLLFLFTLALLPHSVLAANSCFCYFGEKNDCQKVTVTSTGQAACDALCQTTYPNEFKAPATYTDDLLESAKFEGQCMAAHQLANTIEPTQAEGAVLPDLEIDIPGVTFTPILQRGNLLEITFLADYLNGMYQYLLGIGVVIAVVMLMVGGIQWAISPGVPSQLSKAQTRMKNAVIGLVLLIGVATILQSINPQLALLQPIHLSRIEAVDISLISPQNYQNLTGEVLDLSPGTRSQNALLAYETAKQNDVPACMAFVIVNHESGGNPAIIGHDENYPGPNAVGSRYEFLKSQQTYSGITSGATFSRPPLPFTKEGYKNLSNSERRELNSTPIYNDDGSGARGKYADLGQPPDFGIDWRFTHGIGLGQITFKDGSFCTVNGEKIRGTKITALNKCLTLPELLTVKGGVEAMVGRMKFWYNKAKIMEGYSGSPDEAPEAVIRRAFGMYGAGGTGGDLQRASINKRVGHYFACVNQGIGDIKPIDTPSVEESSAPEDYEAL